MNLAEFSVKRALFVNLITLFVYTAGMVSMFHLRREAFPEVSFDVVTVQTLYPGAPAEDVEKLVTIPIEKELKSVSGVKEMNSSSSEGTSKISLTLQPDIKDKGKALDDIRQAADRATDLPAEAEDPLVTEITTKERPILEISLSGNLEEFQKRHYAEILEDRILDVDGVASVRRFGWRDKEIWVEVDPLKLQEYYVSFDEVVNALRSRNVTIPAGRLRTESEEYNLRISSEFLKAQDIEDVIIRANDLGNWLKIKDIAQVEEAFEDETRIAKINGEKAAAMVVVKNETADAIKVADEVKVILENFKKELPPELKVTVTNDFSYYIKRRLGVIQGNGLFGFALVILVLFLFMHPAPAIMTALGIPFALLATFAAMNFMGLTINLITMIGLIVVLGMIVDDGIIVSENVYRHMEQGLSVREATIKGTREVMLPVIASITTTWAAFIPLLFMKDIIGKFIKFIPMVVIIALAASLLEAFVILPSHLCEFLKISHREHKKKIEHKSWLVGMRQGYIKILETALKKRYRIAFSIFILFIAAIFAVKFFMKVVLFTGEGLEQFYVRAEAPKGTSLHRMNELISNVEHMLKREIPPGELDSFRTFLGSIEEERGFDASARQAPHLGQITVFLTPLQQRKRTPQEIVESLRPHLDQIKGFEKLYFFKPREGPPGGAPVSVAIRGEDFKIMLEISDKVKSFLKGIPGVTDISTNFDTGKKQIKVIIDEQKARQFYLTVEQAAKTVRSAFQGGLATTLKPSKAEEEIDILVRFPEEIRHDLKAFEQILVLNQNNKLVPLNSVARIEETEGIFAINHLDGKRVMTIFAQVDNKNATSLSVNQRLSQEIKKFLEEYPAYTIKLTGEYEDQRESLMNLLTAFGLALLMIFIILVAMFGSLLEPFIVFLTIPLGIIGVIWAFLAHGRPLSFLALMGIVGLMGVVVNAAIIMVDFINRLRLEGKPLNEAIVGACEIRLRPILMTVITTIAGLISVAYGIGGGDPFLKPLALAMVWGLVFATLITLFAIPCVYAIFDDLHQKIFHRPMTAVPT